ncbi:uncharacterized protein EI90DRAFT_3041505 [Cantharellus anzutake]|uniref:uncharacterized protein n=1 Tax=Cantharellus anzutake TaxID=1750568 RepID=UPI0019060A07|nr:uncharacterized protein EI90DRAFT_3041505 [Cantharellus anzutake]KAF8338073.1 hypothetical protein EI90DRAFT_3041505 [Cantharellus anzutake]
MPFGRSMGDMLGNQMLTQLKLIEMDGFQDLEPLMRLTPNLKVLRLTMSSGFSQSANAELVQALAHVPHLRELVFSPETLRLYTPFTEDNLLGDFDEITEVTENGTNVEIIKSIGKLVPELEILDLRNRWFGMKGMFFPPSVEPIRSNALVEAVKQLPNLRSLALPSSVVSLRDFTTIRAPPGIRLPPGFPTWDEAMEHIADAEVRTVQGIGAACNDIQNVAFTRPLSDALRLEYSVNYEVGIFQPHDLALSRGTARTEYPTHTDVHLPVISRADVDQEDASSCFGPSHALTGTLRTVWRASSPAIRKEKIIKLVKEHEFFVTVMLCVSVCVVAELGKIVLCMALDTKRAEVASSAVIAGGALFILSPLLQWQLPFESDR